MDDNWTLNVEAYGLVGLGCGLASPLLFDANQVLTNLRYPGDPDHVLELVLPPVDDVMQFGWLDVSSGAATFPFSVDVQPP